MIRCKMMNKTEIHQCIFILHEQKLLALINCNRTGLLTDSKTCTKHLIVTIQKQS